MLVAISSSFGIDLLAEAALALAYKAEVPVLMPQQLVLTDLQSPLTASEQRLFGVLVALYLTPSVYKTRTAQIGRLALFSHSEDMLPPAQSVILLTLFALVNPPINAFKGGGVFDWPAEKPDLLLLFFVGGIRKCLLAYLGISLQT